MNTAYKPEGYSAVSPYLMVNEAQQVINFLKEVFDATELRRFERPDGSIMHAEVRIEDSVIMLGEAAESWPAYPSHLHVYVQDVDAVYKRALAAGAASVQAPEQKGDPDKRGGVMGPGGNTWWIATQMGL